MPPQPLAAELKTSSKEELLIPRSVALRFSVQIGLISISRETLLFGREILTFLGGPSRQPFRGVFPFIPELLGLFWIVHSPHPFGRQIMCSCSRATISQKIHRRAVIQLIPGFTS